MQPPPLDNHPVASTSTSSSAFAPPPPPPPAPSGSTTALAPVESTVGEPEAAGEQEVDELEDEPAAVTPATQTVGEAVAALAQTSAWARPASGSVFGKPVAEEPVGPRKRPALDFDPALIAEDPGDGDYEEGKEPEPSASTPRTEMMNDAKKAAEGIPQVPCPRLPKPGAPFDNLIDLYKAIVKALVPTYGIGARMTNLGKAHSGGVVCNRQQSGCPFNVKWSSGLVAADSITLHNHGAEPKLLRDPAWRPWFKSQHAMDAIAELDREHHPLRQLPSDADTFLPFLSAFLASVDPSLPALAEPLAAGGLSSVRALAIFSLLEPGSRVAMYEEIEERKGIVVTNEQVDLLEEAFRRAAIDVQA
ncbi:hypothetical protein JCM8097_003795 [Rhodosporidiobolus ruineniae]